MLFAAYVCFHILIVWVTEWPSFEKYLLKRLTGGGVREIHSIHSIYVHPGEPVSYTNWIQGRKINFVSHTVEDCVAYIPYKQDSGTTYRVGVQEVLSGIVVNTPLYV